MSTSSLAIRDSVFRPTCLSRLPGLLATLLSRSIPGLPRFCIGRRGQSRSSLGLHYAKSAASFSQSRRSGINGTIEGLAKSRKRALPPSASPQVYATREPYSEGKNLQCLAIRNCDQLPRTDTTDCNGSSCTYCGGRRCCGCGRDMHGRPSASTSFSRLYGRWVGTLHYRIAAISCAYGGAVRPLPRRLVSA